MKPCEKTLKRLRDQIREKAITYRVDMSDFEQAKWFSQLRQLENDYWRAERGELRFNDEVKS